MHLTLGSLRKSQAVSYAFSFFHSDGFAVPAPAQVSREARTGRAANRWAADIKYMRKLILFFVSVELILVSCSNHTSNPCDSEFVVNEIPSQWSWLQLQIGTSTEKELVEKLGSPYAKTSEAPSRNRKQGACIYQYRDLVEGYVTFWIISGRVMGVEFSPPSYPLSVKAPVYLSQAVEKYGKPEIVGYNSPYGSHVRTVIWESLGVLAAVSVNPEPSSTDLMVKPEESMIINLLYFAPTQSEKFTDSFWSVRYSEKLSNDDVIDILPKDPFIWDE